MIYTHQKETITQKWKKEMKTNETFCVNSKGNLIEIGNKANNFS